MEGFGIDKLQAEYVAEIKLRNLNKEYILKNIKDIADLQRDIEEINLELILSDLESVNKRLERTAKAVKADNNPVSLLKSV